MNLPSLFLSILLSTLCGLLFNFIRGGRIARLGLYIITAWISFIVGHLVGQWLGWTFLRLGTLNIFPALVATVVGLIVASILAGPDKPLAHRRRRR